MAGRTPSREEDETVLAMITARCKGFSTTTIGRVFDTPSAHVRTVTNRVRDDDIKAEGPHVRDAYWKGRNRG